jgi:hypothetical protein
MIRKSGNRFSKKITLIKMAERQPIHSEAIADAAAGQAGETGAQRTRLPPIDNCA